MKDKSPKETKATALKYDGENAPKVVAKGQGKVAKDIIAVAEEHNIHIHNDPILHEVLSRLELGDEIPKQLYLAVAKIIAFAYFLQGKHPQNHNNKTQDNSSSKKLLASAKCNKNYPV